MNRPAFLLPALLLLFLGAALQAAVPDAVGWINDYSGRLDPGARSKISHSLDELRRQGVSGAVAVVSGTRPLSLAAWTQEAWQAWGLADRPQGMLVVLDLDAKAVELALGPALQGIVSQPVWEQMVATEAPREALERSWSLGLVALVSALEDRLQTTSGSVVAMQPVDTAPSERPRPLPIGHPAGLVRLLGDGLIFLLSPWNTPLVLAGFWMLWVFSLPMRRLFFHRRLGWIGAGLLVYVAIASRYLPGAWEQLPLALIFLLLGFLVSLYTLSRRCHRCKAGYLEVFSRTLREPSADREGRGEVTVSCPRCTFHHVSTFALPTERYADPVPTPPRDSAEESAAQAFGGGRSGGAGASRSF